MRKKQMNHAWGWDKLREKLLEEEQRLKEEAEKLDYATSFELMRKAIEFTAKRDGVLEVLELMNKMENLEIS